jgi:Pyruvate phosphate dikinase, AMP/ATP-binding domain
MCSMERHPVPDFCRGTWESDVVVSRIGPGRIGGKAAGLVLLAKEFMDGIDHGEFPEFTITIPRMVVLGTEVFESFMEMNNLWEVALSGASEDRIANAFLGASLVPEILGDLRDFISQVKTPLAVRSSSLLEDALDHPFAGVYATKMIPNNQPDTDTRYQHLDEAIRLIYASTFFDSAKSYFQGVGQDHSQERMGVVIQEVVGNRHGNRFYPEISGVCRSFNYYPNGAAVPTDGVANLALGLGRQIVDGGLSWGYCPKYPTSPPPFNDVGDRMRGTQTTFWSVNMGTPPPPDPMGETEFLLVDDLTTAEDDQVLDHLVSTYDHRSDCLRMGLSCPGPRVLDFGPILVGKTLALNKLILAMLPLAERTIGCPVELEFAVDRNEDGKLRVCLLQMRPMAIPEGESKISPMELNAQSVILASERTLGHGTKNNIEDIVFIKPETFDASRTRAVAQEIQSFNHDLFVSEKPYVLIGFGRWGSSDPWLGVPVEWGMVSGAGVIVEASFQNMNPDPSQGAHFFHNLISFGVFYMTVRGKGSSRVDWDWLARQHVVRDGEFLRHIKVDQPLDIRADGLAGLGLIKAGGAK